MGQQESFRIAERRRSKTDMQRWCAKVRLPEFWKEEACWEWVGTKGRLGYGLFYPGGRRGPGVNDVPSHRFGYERFVGSIPDGMHLDHLCRNHSCVNPSHLEPVSPKENLRRSPAQLSTINASKTHCLRGHEFTPENTYFYVGKSHKTGARHCVTCRKNWALEHRAPKENLYVEH